MRIAIILAGMLAATAITPAQALTIAFDGNICNGGTACGNGSVIDQSYGDIAGQLDVQWRADATAAVSTNNGFRWWSTQYSDLVNVGYGTNTSGGASIFFAPSAGYTVTLSSFKLGAWPNSNRSTSYTIFDGANNLLAGSGGPITVNGGTATIVIAGFTSSDGIGILFGPDSFNVGIDDIEFSVTPLTAAIPEPSSWAMMIAGFGLAGAALRRRTHRAKVGFA